MRACVKRQRATPQTRCTLAESCTILIGTGQRAPRMGDEPDNANACTERKMPLPPSTHQRRHIHTRRIVCEAFERDDGLWDVEANMTDAKTYDVERASAGEPVHNMWVRMT